MNLILEKRGLIVRFDRGRFCRRSTGLFTLVELVCVLVAVKSLVTEEMSSPESLL